MPDQHFKHLVFPTVSASCCTALIKSCHWFISTTCLNLHKESSIVITLWTLDVCSVNVLPCSGSTKHVVYLSIDTHEHILLIIFKKKINVPLLVLDKSCLIFCTLYSVCRGKWNRKNGNNVVLLQHQGHLHTLDKTSTCQNANEMLADFPTSFSSCFYKFFLLFPISV